MSMVATSASEPSLSYLQMVDAPAVTLLRPLRVGSSITKLQVMSKILLSELIFPLVVWWAVMLMVWAAVGAAGGASRPVAEAGAAGLIATNIAAPAPRAAVNAATGRRVINTEIFSSTC